MWACRRTCRPAAAQRVGVPHARASQHADPLRRSVTARHAPPAHGVCLLRSSPVLRYFLVGALLFGVSCSSKYSPSPSGEKVAPAPAPAANPPAANPTAVVASTAPPALVPPKLQPAPKVDAELTVLDLPDLRGRGAAVMLPDGKAVAACGDDGKIQLIAVPSKEVTGKFDGFPGAPRLAVSPDGKLLAQGSDQETRVVLWDIEKRSEVKVLSAHKLPISDLAFSPDGAKLATSSRSPGSGVKGEIKVWSLAGSSDPLSLKVANGIVAVAFSPKGDLLASAGVVAAGAISPFRPKTEEIYVFWVAIAV